MFDPGCVLSGNLEQLANWQDWQGTCHPEGRTVAPYRLSDSCVGCFVLTCHPLTAASQDCLSVNPEISVPTPESFMESMGMCSSFIGFFSRVVFWYS